MTKYNPAHFEIDNIEVARFFVIKSYSEDDIHRSIKYNIWCSTEHGNKRLDQAFHEREKEAGAVYLFYSVNGSGHFCGMAQMISNVDYSSNSSVWAQNKWKGSFKVRWIYVKDVPNPQLRAIRLENNENKPVTNSRDTQEVPNAKGEQVWRIIHSYKHSTSLFDDFVHYEQRQREEDSRRVEPGQGSSGTRTPPPPHQYRSGGYQESNNNPRDSFNGGGRNNYERGEFLWQEIKKKLKKFMLQIILLVSIAITTETGVATKTSPEEAAVIVIMVCIYFLCNFYLYQKFTFYMKL